MSNAHGKIKTRNHLTVHVRIMCVSGMQTCGFKCLDI